ncbi:hypothetical protein [Photobacterium kishitanii]|uniref:Uncharacterized protein n=1 Tax=Photobacterium kishitanii TaxID=318456 RepID=A0A2T3KN33_9GAMM|nr:hypothetical protein [Photobacterium kishitanii]PSV01188.1 hypothetical protein C9J27_03960 [Photobacterium kishitanii]
MWAYKKGIITLDGVDFVTTMSWSQGGTEKSAIKKKFAINSQLLSRDATSGCLLEKGDNYQLASCAKEFEGMPVLASLFFGKRKNCTLFAQLDTDLFWCISFNCDGFVSLSIENDTYLSLRSLRNFIKQEILMSDSPDHYVAYNIGTEEVSLNSVELSNCVIYEGFDTSGLSENNSAIKVKKQIGDLKKKITISFLSVFAAAGVATYYIMTHIPDGVLRIENGDYSSGFTQTYNQLKNQEKKLIVVANDSNKVLTPKDVKKAALSEFNEYVLLRDRSNLSIVKKVIDVRLSAPRLMDGWGMDSIIYSEDRIQLRYKRLGKYPSSAPYNTTDKDIVSYMGDRGVNISPVRLESKGEVRIYEVVPLSETNAKFSAYLTEKRKSSEGREKLVSAIKEKQAKLDMIKLDIEDNESSVSVLSTLDRYNDDVLSLFKSSITDKVGSAKPIINRLKSDLAKLKDYPSLNIPENREFMLIDKTVEDELYPILQSSRSLTWTKTEKASGGFPSIIDKKAISIQQGAIAGYDIKMVIDNGIVGACAAGNILSNKTVFLDSVYLQEKGNGTASMSLDIRYYKMNKVS